MIKLHVELIKTGMYLAKPIYDQEGKILLEAGLEIKETFIKKLKAFNIDEVYIKWDEMADEEMTPIIAESTYRAAIHLTKQTMDGIKGLNPIEIEKIQKVVSEMVNELLSSKVVVYNLVNIRTTDDYTFEHSVNVCVLAIIMGCALGYDKENLKKLGLGALLHDIGKMTVDQKILNKPDQLTIEEYNEIKKHSTLGYEIIEPIQDLEEEVKWVIRDHHERYDGKGYPKGLKREEVHEFSRIVAICDVYDALTSNRIYRKAISPHQAIEYLISMGNHQFDYQLVRVFINNVMQYPIGTLVKLATGEKGVIVSADKQFPTRPIVEVLDDNFKSVEGRRRINLMEDLANSIAVVL